MSWALVKVIPQTLSNSLSETIWWVLDLKKSWAPLFWTKKKKKIDDSFFLLDLLIISYVGMN